MGRRLQRVDWKTAVAVFLPIVTLVLGGVLQRWNASSVEKAQLEREQKVRETERRQARLDRREEFELNQLKDLHSALGELLSQALLRKARTIDGEDATEAEQGYDQANREVRSLVGLTLRDDIREAADKAHDTVALMNIGAGQAGLTPSTPAQAGYHVGRAQFVIAARIRELYTADDSEALDRTTQSP